MNVIIIYDVKLFTHGFPYTNTVRCCFWKIFKDIQFTLSVLFYNLNYKTDKYKTVLRFSFVRGIYESYVTLLVNST